MEAADSDESLRAAFEDSSHELLILETGYRKPLSMLTMSDQQDLVKMLKAHILFRVKPELDQFRNGLKTCGILEAVESHLELMSPLFTCTRCDLTGGVCIIIWGRWNLILCVPRLF